MKSLFQNRKTLFITVLVISTLFGNISSFAYQESLKVNAYQMSVNGVVWFIVEDKSALENLLEEYKSSYLDGINENAVQVSTSFEQQVELSKVRVNGDEITTIDKATVKITAIEKNAVIHTVERGDSLWAIAEKYDIPLSTIIVQNPNLDPELIFSGQKIVLEPVDPVLDVIVSYRTTVLEDIPYTTKYIKDNSLYSGYRSVLEKGVNGSKEVTYEVTNKNGYSNVMTKMSEVELSQPVESVVKVGSMKTLSKTSSSNFGVVVGQLSSNYGWRKDPISNKRLFHSGLDIAAEYGSAIYAYTSGKVVDAGWNNIRGFYVTIQHVGGLSTSYLHMSKALVVKGQTVNVGQQIGKVGSTGYSTGNHLHFTVLKGGKYQNPWDYL